MITPITILAPIKLAKGKNEADIAIRISEGPPEHLVGRKVARYQNGFFASLDYLKLINKKPPAPWIGWSDEAYSKRVLGEAGSSNIKVQHHINHLN